MFFSIVTKPVNLKKKVSINVKDQTIDKILDQVLLQTGNAYSIDDRQVFIGVAAKTNETPLHCPRLRR